MLGSLIYLLIVAVVIGVVFWLVDYIPVPQPLNKLIKVVAIVIGVIIIIGVLLSLAGVNLGGPVTVR
jgi:hypothetical protein